MINENTWREVPTKTDITVMPGFRTFIEYDNRGRKTGRTKYIYPNFDASSNHNYVYIVDSESRTTTSG